MEILLVLISLVLISVGFIGSFIPLLPGPFLAYLGLLLFHFGSQSISVSPVILVFLGVLVLLISVLDYFMPIYGSRFFGGSKYGAWGSSIGLLVGVFTSWFGPWGIIFGPFLGAFLAELIFKQKAEKAFLAAWGAFLGFLGSTFVAAIYCFIVAFVVVVYLLKNWI